MQPTDEPTLDCAATVRAQELEDGTWLVLLRADSVPHVMLLQAGVCFSLEVDGNRRHPAAKLLRLIESKRVPALLCRLAPDAPATVASFVAPFERIASGGNCFLPVRDYCASWLAAAGPCELAFELVERLAAAGKLAHTVGLHLTHPSGTRFRLPRYTSREVEARLDELRRERDLG